MTDTHGKMNHRDKALNFLDLYEYVEGDTMRDYQKTRAIVHALLDISAAIREGRGEEPEEKRKKAVQDAEDAMQGGSL